MQIQPPAFQNQYIAERIQALGIPNYSEPELYCGSGNKISLICINRYCTVSSLHCEKKDCNSCQKHHQTRCLKFGIDVLTKILQRKSHNLTYLMEQMMKIEVQMLNNLEKRKRKMFQKIKKVNLKNQEMEILYGILGLSNYWKKVRGFQAYNIITKLQKNNQKQRVDDQLRILNEKMSQITDQIFDLQRKAILEIRKPTKQYVRVDSQIMERDPEGMKYILHELNYPLQVNLLFRASEHGFSAQAFHNRCDNKPNTLTIIRTVNNKVIAGFTPITWETNRKDGQGQFNQDEDQKTFVLSVTHRQRYQQMEEGLNAVYCCPKFGPAFGQNDFTLLDGDPQKGTLVFTEFPASFDYRKSYEDRPDTMQRILGNGQDKFVQVNEYEVYEVLKDPQRQA